MINNNRQQNGRRRGRGGQRQGGGHQGNGSRIDNRARGNAAQLLEKYKSLASDAQRQGDRVNTEYYLQFADHYFRVVSEQRGRFEEQDRQRQGGHGGYDDQFDGGEDFDGDEGEGREAQSQAQRQPARDDNRDRDGQRDRDGRGHRRFDGERDGNRDPAREQGREPRRERFPRDRADEPSEGVVAHEGVPIAAAEPPARPRRGRPPRADAPAPGDTFDADRLPPAFAPANDGDAAAPAEAAAEVKPRRRRLRPAGEASQAG